MSVYQMNNLRIVDLTKTLDPATETRRRGPEPGHCRKASEREGECVVVPGSQGETRGIWGRSLHQKQQ